MKTPKRAPYGFDSRDYKVNATFYLKYKIACVEWTEIQRVMHEIDISNGMYARFCTWMNGQTACEGGVYVWDLDRFLRGKAPLD